MALESDLQAMMFERVQVYPFTGYDAYGAPSYSATATTHPARVSLRSKAIKDRLGRDVIAQSRVYIGPSSTGGLPDLDVEDRLVLPDGSNGSILMVDKLDDEVAAHHVVAYCG